MHRRRFLCRRKRFKILLKVAALNVAAPFTVALYGDATILPPATMDELVVEVGCCNARWHARLMRYAHRWRCTHN
jgi:hypothetical protein